MNILQIKCSQAQEAYGNIVSDSDALPNNHVVLETFCMKCGGCFNSLNELQKDNVIAVLRTLKNLARYHRGQRSPDIPVCMMILAKPMDKSVPMGACNVRAFMVCQVSLCPLDLCLWECVVSPEGDSGFCQDVQCPKTFTAALDFIVHLDLGSDSSQMGPRIQTMHQLAFSLRNVSLEEDYRLKVIPGSGYEVVSLHSVRVRDADSVFDVVDDTNQGNDDGDSDLDDDPRHKLVQKCMDLLKGKNKQHKAPKVDDDFFDEDTSQAKPRQRFATDEPRVRKSGVRKHAESSAASAKTTASAAPETGHSDMDVEGISGSYGEVTMKSECALE